MNGVPPALDELPDQARHAAIAQTTRSRLAIGRLGRFLLWLWATLAAIWVAALTGIGLLALAVVPLGILGALRAERRWAASVASRVLADTFAAITLGRLVEAEATLTGLASSTWLPSGVRRLVAIQQGLCAVRRGDMRAALAPLDRAVELPAARGEHDAAYQRSGALAFRALARASIGQREAALADVLEVRSARSASPDAMARASLAEALVLEAAGERDALRELLERDRRILREATHPRERAIARALERLVRTPRATPYRIAEPRVENGDEPPVETWLARVAPSLAAFAESRRQPSARSLLELAAPAPTAGGIAAVAAARGATATPMWPLVLLTLGAFGGLSWLLTGGGGPAGDVGAAGPATTSATTALAVLATFAGAGTVSLLGRLRARRRDRRRLIAARQGGPGASGAASLEELAASGDDATAAQARLLLADAAEREARWSDVLTEADRGLARVGSPAVRRETGLLAPDLIGLRAFALAVLGRAEEADAELASISGGYPHYPRALYRVRLVQELRAGRLAAAAAHVEALSGDLPLSLREELLSDLVRAIASPSGVTHAEAVRLADELASDEGSRAWIAAVAPGVLTAFDGEPTALGVPAATAPGARIVDLPQPREVEADAPPRVAALDAAVLDQATSEAAAEADAAAHERPAARQGVVQRVDRPPHVVTRLEVAPAVSRRGPRRSP